MPEMPSSKAITALEGWDSYQNGGNRDGRAPRTVKFVGLGEDLGRRNGLDAASSGYDHLTVGNTKHYFGLRQIL
jgi:hypothetical protein